MGQKPETKHDELLRVARDFEAVMLCTVARDGSVHARPMMVAEVDDQNRWWFVTPRATGKVVEVENDGHAAVTIQNKKTFVSLAGRARVVGDRARLHEVWRSRLDAWFPRGADDPSAVLICFEPAVGEYWAQDKIDAIKLTAERARAMFTGGSVDPSRAGDHVKVAIH